MTCQKMIIIPPKNVSWIEFGLFGKKKHVIYRNTDAAIFCKF